MELKQLQTFRSVAQELSFTRAAEKLNYAQSSVTAQIQALEEELGTPLFERLGRRVTLTVAGQRLVTYAERLLALADEAGVAVPGDPNPSGCLVIGVPESLCAYRLPPLLQRFRMRYPNVELTFRTGLCSDLRRDVGRGVLDMAFTMEPPVSSDTLNIETLLREPMVLVADPLHPLAACTTVATSDLDGQALLLSEKGCSYRTLMDDRLAAAKVELNARMEFFSIEAMKQCVMAGLGIAILPEMAVMPELADGRLKALKWSTEDIVIQTQMAYHKDKWLSPALSAFMEMAREVLRQKEAA